MSLKLIYDQRFWPIFWTQFLGSLNDNFLKNALVVLITFKGLTLWGIESNSLVALAGGIFILPFFLFSSMAGQFADKWEKSFLTKFIKICELGIMFLAGTGFYTHSPALLMFSLFLMGLHSAFFGPIKYSILLDLLPESRLVTANAYIEMGTFLAILIGTISGGLVIALQGGEIYIIAGLIGISLIGILTSFFMPKVPVSQPNLKIILNPITPVAEILRVAKRTVVFNSILGISWFWFFGAALLSLIPIYTKDVLHASEEVATLFLSLFTIGIAVGSVVCEKLSFERVEIGLVPIGSIGMTLFLADLFFATPSFFSSGFELLSLRDFLHHEYVLRILIDFFGLSIFGGLFIVPLYTLIQQRSEKEYRSRIIAGNNILNALFMVVSSITITWFHHMKLTVPQMFLLLAAMNLAVSFYIYPLLPEFTLRLLSWVRRKKTR